MCSESSARDRRGSRKITSRSCLRSWPASRAAISKPTSANRRDSLSGISSRGLRGCSPTSSYPGRPTSTVPSAGSAVSLWSWNPRPLRCPSDIEGTKKIDVEEIAMSKPSDRKTSLREGKSRAAAGVDRRRFFLMGGSAVAAAAVVPLASEAEADESQAERVKARYRESDHVKNYYRVNRY